MKQKQYSMSFKTTKGTILIEDVILAIAHAKCAIALLKEIKKRLEKDESRRNL